MLPRVKTTEIHTTINENATTEKNLKKMKINKAVIIPTTFYLVCKSFEVAKAMTLPDLPTAL